ncbi:MAG: hypothetical protein HY002_22525 [Candidatus Rokubacteria bacterium]|nr:hypothetical protein [Candidatus Rokubacteria bacterium]
MLIEEALREALAQATRGQVSFRREFEGFPGTAHGGAVAALFYRVTTPRPPVRLRMNLIRGVPTDTPLQLTTGSTGALARLALAQGSRGLADAELTRERISPLDPAPTLAAWQQAHTPEGEVPGTATCLACGSTNPLGLRIRFFFNERFLWQEYTPRESYRAANGSLHAALTTIMLDELGWWLGALAQGECGVTTEVAITVFRPLPFAPLLVLGDRTAVRADDDPRARYSRASGLLLTADGQLLAAGEVRFAGSRAYTKRLLEPFLEVTESEALYRLFPTARSLSIRAPADPPSS